MRSVARQGWQRCCTYSHTQPGSPASLLVICLFLLVFILLLTFAPCATYPTTQTYGSESKMGGGKHTTCLMVVSFFLFITFHWIGMDVTNFLMAFLILRQHFYWTDSSFQSLATAKYSCAVIIFLDLDKFLGTHRLDLLSLHQRADGNGLVGT